MKKLFFILFIGAVSPALAGAGGAHFGPAGSAHFGPASRKATSIPSAVTSAFAQRYPDAQVRRWTAMNDNDFAVRFRLHDVRYTAVFQPDGNWEKTVRIFAPTHRIPDGVRQGFRHSGYEGCNIDGLKEVVTPGQKLFVIAVDDGDYYDSNHHDAFTKDFLLTFTTEGKLIKTTRAEFRDSGGL